MKYLVVDKWDNVYCADNDKVFNDKRKVGEAYSNIRHMKIARVDEWIGAYFKLFLLEDGFYLHFKVYETYIRNEITIDNDPVYHDSCVGFYVDPFDDGTYYSFEFNSIGTLLLSYGGAGENRELAHSETLNKIIRKHKIVKKGRGRSSEWFLDILIPYDALFKHKGQPINEYFRANFFKCGDLCKEPHYHFWNYIPTNQTDFHQPKFFGLCGIRLNENNSEGINLKELSDLANTNKAVHKELSKSDLDLVWRKSIDEFKAKCKLDYSFDLDESKKKLFSEIELKFQKELVNLDFVFSQFKLLSLNNNFILDFVVREIPNGKEPVIYVRNKNEAEKVYSDELEHQFQQSPDLTQDYLNHIHLDANEMSFIELLMFSFLDKKFFVHWHGGWGASKLIFSDKDIKCISKNLLDRMANSQVNQGFFSKLLVKFKLKKELTDIQNFYYENHKKALKINYRPIIKNDHSKYIHIGVVRECKFSIDYTEYIISRSFPHQIVKGYSKQIISKEYYNIKY